MHPTQDFYHRNVDFTQKFKDIVNAIIADAKKALVLADCDCPFPAESQMAKILTSVREATQIVKTVADDYQYRVPASYAKKTQIKEAWERSEESK